MKIEDLTYDIISEETVGDDTVVFAVMNEGVGTQVFQTLRRSAKGGLLRNIKQVITNPVVAGLAAGYAINAYKKYKSNKHKTTQFLAKDHHEREFYKKVVNDLMKTGHYKKVREKYVEGGYLWELRRTS